MKKLCLFFIIPQFLFAPFTAERDQINSTSTHAKENVVPLQAKRPNVSRSPKVVAVIDQGEPNADRLHNQSKAKKLRTKAKKLRKQESSENAREISQERQEALREQSRTRTHQQSEDAAKARVIKTEVTNDQQAKIQNIKNSLNNLQEDVTFRDVFKHLDLDEKIQSLMSHISDKIDEQATQADLDAVQDFLKNLAGKKHEIQQMDEVLRSKFLAKLAKVPQQNFSKLSVEEVQQFLTLVPTMTEQALAPQLKKSASKKSISDDNDDAIPSRAPEKQEQRKSLAKGGMPSGNLDMFGFMIGLSFTAGIFELMSTLANEN